VTRPALLCLLLIGCSWPMEPPLAVPPPPQSGDVVRHGWMPPEPLHQESTSE
jgi:hypothetical protein